MNLPVHTYLVLPEKILLTLQMGNKCGTELYKLATLAHIQTYNFHGKVVNQLDIGVGGLVVSLLASGTQDHGFAPGRSRRIFWAKMSSACLPSEGK
jgi:hypothetical protein